MSKQEPLRIQINGNIELVDVLNSKEENRHYIRLSEGTSFRAQGFEQQRGIVSDPIDIPISKAQYNELKAQLTEPRKNNVAYVDSVLEIQVGSNCCN